ncbi:MAG: ComEC/Rec2 family competence protein, partial [Chitinophagaceae bacterium]
MHVFSIPLWKKAPFTRLLLPLITGIIIQRFSSISASQLAIALVIALVFILIIGSAKIQFRYKSVIVIGLLLNLAVAITGALIYNCNDVRLRKNWYGNLYHPGDHTIISIIEKPVEKKNSYKAEAMVSICISDSSLSSTSGNVIIYFEKDSSIELNYGDRFIFKKPFQEIKNSGNPGAFDYKTYAAFKGIYHQVYLKKDECVKLDDKRINAFDEFLIRSRQSILSTLRKYIQDLKLIGIAEALLIGYKEDLDKDLVQAYSDTGVVHIIAISGLHLGLIYVMLLWIVNKLPFIKRSRFFKLLIILSSLWLFSLLTGGSASVLRSAVMFTCILAGDTLQRKASIYNSLAASAFILLCYNPYMLWDVGFQLSYLAVAGIVSLQKPIYNFLYVRNKWLDKIWKLLAISLAAQVLTTPVCIYYFHQFPNYFLLTNLIAVPLSSLILFLEIILLVVAKLPVLPLYLGQLISWLIWIMNEFVFIVQKLPYALTRNIHQEFFETIIIYALLLSFCCWWIKRMRQAMIFTMTMMLLLGIGAVYQGFRRGGKIIVYNIPRQSAIDIIHDGTYYFIGDTNLEKKTADAKFHLLPSRIFYDAATPADSFPGLK